ncbi:MAG: hypothetical protein ACPG8W_08445 [Candidatus Promineifilaceae bacterium]
MNPDSNNTSVWKELILAYHILRDPNTPFYIKMMPLAAVFYCFFPEGAFAFPLLTPIDDLAIFYVALKGFIHLTPPQIVTKHQKTLGMDVLEGEYQVVENNMPEKELDASIVLNPDRMATSGDTF